MRSLIQQTALGLVMSAGTVALCSVPSDSTASKARPEVGLPMCAVATPPPIDLTQRPNDTGGPAPGAASDGESARTESPAMRRLRLAEDALTPRRDYFDERWEDDEPRRSAPRASRRKDRLASEATRLVSGLESPNTDPASQDRVRRQVRFLTESREGRNGFGAALERSGRYEEIISRALDDRRLPRALMAAALVESGFSPTAVSPAGAAGLWQFMPGTAKIYGLRVDRGYDERFCPWKSSEAAAEHLADLYERFRSWELALAAYNMGYNGLESRLAAHHARTFWELANIEGGLPEETALYVPRVLAAAVVMANLDAFGFDSVERNAPLMASEVEVPLGMPVHLIARAAGMPIRAFREFNGELVGTSAPRAGDPVVVHLPTSIVDRTRAILARLDRGEIDPEDLERPRDDRPRTAWASAREGRARTAWDRDSSWEPRGRDDRSGYGRFGMDGRAAREPDRSRSRALRTFDDDPRYSFPLYARDARDRHDAEARDGDRDFERPAPRRRRTEASTVFYRTVDGDTSETVGKTFGISAEEVCAQNGLKAGSALEKGTLLRLRVSTKTLEKLGSVATQDG
ncbi:MAG TPA: lytic transglycosylase domain-containing protein [Labilithrix sp.]|nr:lytic transglycosylase domain-containing protein [Labilithrix sp.]